MKLDLLRGISKKGGRRGFGFISSSSSIVQ